MHAWHTETGTNLQALHDSFDGYRHACDEGYDEARGIRFINREFKSENEAADAAGSASYGDDKAVCYPVLGKKKKTKTYETALTNYLKAEKEYASFMKTFSFATGKKATLITCPKCGSKISVQIANSRNMQSCPVCGSSAIMPESAKKKRAKYETAVTKASSKLSEAASKCDIKFVARLEWHE